MNKLFHGAGGGKKPKKPVNTPDNLFSEDVVEFALAVSEGPIRGLQRGAKSFYVGDTPLVAESGDANFDKFAIGVHPGYPEGSARELELKLGGQSSNFVVGVALLQNVEVTRQTSAVLRNQIDELEVRINFQRLLKSTQKGTFNNTAKLKIQYKTTLEAETEWKNFFEISETQTVTYKDWLPVTRRFTYAVPNGTVVSKNDVIAYADNIDTGGYSGFPLFSAVRRDDYREIRATHTGAVTFLLADNWEGVLHEQAVAELAPASGVNGVIELTGKTTSGYSRDFRVDVPRIPDADWMIKVTKLNPDNHTEEFCDMAWESFQGTTKGKVAYPNTAIIHGIGVSNGQFSSIPQFSGVYDGLIVRVPTNYNPDLRTYDDSTPWDGTFKFAWTNNPAWVLYDLVVNPRYGLAAYYPYVDANRFDFYLAARWCDELVPDGVGGQQPRFTYNDVIAEPRNALEMLNYVAGAFNAVIWDDLSGKIHLRVDRDDPAEMLFTPENITVEGFQYTFTDLSTRVNDISVVYINPVLDWNEDRRRIPGTTTDETAIAKYGRVPLDFIAVGCTDEKEAIRRARHRLISAQTEKTIVSFITTRLGALLTLYKPILIADPVMGWSMSGRIKSYDAQYVYLRDPIYIETMETYTMKVQTANGITDVAVTPEQVGQNFKFTLVGSLPANMPDKAVFTLEQSGGLGFAKPFRVMSIEEVDGSPYLYRVTALEINRNKYYVGDNLPEIGDFQYSFKQPVVPSAVQGAYAESGDDHVLVTSTGDIVPRIFVSWRPPLLSTPTSYEVAWREVGQEDWDLVTVEGTAVYLSPTIVGRGYEIQVRAVQE